MNQRGKLQGGTREKNAGPFGTVQFVGAERHEIGVELVHSGKGKFAKCLNGIGMEKSAVIGTNLTHLGHRLEGPNLIVGGHQ